MTQQHTLDELVVLHFINQNAFELRDIAVGLRRRKKFGASIHFSIAALEESSKFLLVYCRKHLPDAIFRKRYSHLPKHRITETATFIITQLIVFQFLEGSAKLPMSKRLEKAMKDTMPPLTKLVDRGDPAVTAEAILQVLKLQGNDAFEQRIRGDVEMVERDRTASIYVDVADDLSIVHMPSLMTIEDADYYLEQCEISLAVLNFIRDTSMTVEAFMKSLPKSQQRENAKSVKTLIANFERDFVAKF